MTVGAAYPRVSMHLFEPTFFTCNILHTMYRNFVTKEVGFENRKHTHFSPKQIRWKLGKFVEYVVRNIIHVPLETFTI